MSGRLAFAGLEGGVGAGGDDVAVEEEVAEHGAGLAQFDMAVEGMGYALDGVEFCCDACGAAQGDASYMGNLL